MIDEKYVQKIYKNMEEILKEKIISRTEYIDTIEKYFGTPLIKVIIWQRRVGKSSLLKKILREFCQQRGIAKENIFYINKELPDFDDIVDYESLKTVFSLFLKHTDPKQKIVIAIDEIQDIQEREKFINGYLAKYQERCEIFITGSNSFLLSGELSTYLTGRYIEFPIFPLSFTEFCIFKWEKNKKSKQNFLEYLQFGGLPAIFKMQYDKDPIYPYLLGVYNTIISKDIIQHYQIRNIAFFRDLYKYTLSNIGNIISGKTIRDYLKSQNIAISTDTVLNFLHYAEETFLLYKIRSVNPETKKYFEIYNKYYVGDLGLRNALVGFDFKRDIGKLLENYVYLILQRKGYSVMIWRLKNWQEIDFIAEKWWIKKYFQVCYLLWDEQTMEREYRSLEAINDNREKFVVSFDDIDHGIHKGIKHISILDIEDLI